MEGNLDIVTTHRPIIPPWISSSTSHQMMSFRILKKKKKGNAFGNSKAVKTKKLEIQAIGAADNDVGIYETEVFSSRQSIKIQRYLSIIRKNNCIPRMFFFKTNMLQLRMRARNCLMTSFFSISTRKIGERLITATKASSSSKLTETDKKHF